MLGQDTARLLLDPDFAVGFGVSREEGGIAIGHEGANEGYRCAFLALPRLGEGVVVMTNNDTGDALTAEVIDVVAAELDWPWSGWSTPLWAVLLILSGIVALSAAAVAALTRRRRRNAA